VRSPVQLQVDEQLWGQNGDRAALIASIDHSLRYLQTPRAIEAYRRNPVAGVTRDRVQRSLVRFRQLVLQSNSAEQLQAAVDREFVFFQAAGRDNRGTVQFTGYYEPIHEASRVPTSEFRYPLFSPPPNLARWAKPHPTRLQLEGSDGLQYNRTLLKNLPLVWMRDRLDAYLVQVQGSARFNLTDGTTMTIGTAGTTDYPYTSIGKEMIKSGKFKSSQLTMPNMIRYFKENPAEMNRFLPRNQRFIFFKETKGAPATGSISVPVTAERSIATDKSLFPPGALALIQTRLPYVNQAKQIEAQQVSRYVLDQDTGSAIKGAGRVDVFMGTGELAGDRAGLINTPGQLYYLLLKR
jgi:membrane-bound lytic murein transglycosylase A